MAGLRQKLGDLRVPRRAGLALMASAAVLPVGLSAVGELHAAQTSAWLGLPLVLLGALAWHGSGKRAPGVSRKAARRIARQRAFVVAAFSALLGSVLVSDWPREAAVWASVRQNNSVLENAVCQVRRKYLSLSSDGHYIYERCPVWDESTQQYVEIYDRSLNVRGNTFTCSCRVGMVTINRADINGNADVFLYTEEVARSGRKRLRRVFKEYGPPRLHLMGEAREYLP